MADPQASTGKNHFETLKAWCIRHPYWALTLLTIGALAPFLAKPFNIDDPLFVWAARQIRLHPGNPYGFDVNWYGLTEPMWVVTQNPPLMSYYLALTASVVGWSEIGLHFACLLPAVVAVLGTYRLAKSFCQRPWLAALAALLTPGFLVSSTTVMCDVSMLAFWVWAVIFWVEGINQDRPPKLLVAVILTALAMLTKYNSICLILLLAAYGLVVKRSVAWWSFFLLVPVAILLAYEWVTFQLYGRALFFAATHYAKAAQATGGSSRIMAGLNALTFTGGCFVTALFCSPVLWRRKSLLIFFLCAAILMALALANGALATNYDWLTEKTVMPTEVQIIVWTTGGICVLAAALADAWKNRDAASCLLALWVLGVFVFAAFFNWTVNARSILPMIPAAAILLARRLEQSRLDLPAGVKISIIAGAAISLLSSQADFQTASIVHKSAEQLCTKYAGRSGNVWFGGHWGFQYYMQSFGAWPLDANSPGQKPGDILILQEVNSNTLLPAAKQLTRLGTFAAPKSDWFATLDPTIGAGFYSSMWGPLPIGIGRTAPEIFRIYHFN